MGDINVRRQKCYGRKATQELVKYANRSTEDQHCHLSHIIREPVDNICGDKEYLLRKLVNLYRQFSSKDDQTPGPVYRISVLISSAFYNS